MTPLPVDGRQALTARLQAERTLLRRELELLAIADRWGITADTFQTVGGPPATGDTLARLQASVGRRREYIHRLEAELGHKSAPAQNLPVDPPPPEE